MNMTMIVDGEQRVREKEYLRRSCLRINEGLSEIIEDKKLRARETMNLKLN